MYREELIKQLLIQADHTIQVNANTIYLGFCKKGAPATSSAAWSVCRVQKSGTAFPISTSIMWADGQRNFDKILDNYASLTYTYRQY